ncbi:MAG: DUF4352 domain-containing protein [Gemmatimonadaceae bacterium]|nr:DUF4352 domain-containing protein [Gemmatimonadaceae bacterium]
MRRLSAILSVSLLLAAAASAQSDRAGAQTTHWYAKLAGTDLGIRALDISYDRADAASAGIATAVLILPVDRVFDPAVSAWLNAAEVGDDTPGAVTLTRVDPVGMPIELVALASARVRSIEWPHWSDSSSNDEAIVRITIASPYVRTHLSGQSDIPTSTHDISRSMASDFRVTLGGLPTSRISDVTLAPALDAIGSLTPDGVEVIFHVPVMPFADAEAYYDWLQGTHDSREAQIEILSPSMTPVGTIRLRALVPRRIASLSDVGSAISSTTGSIAVTGRASGVEIVPRGTTVGMPLSSHLFHASYAAKDVGIVTVDAVDGGARAFTARDEEAIVAEKGEQLLVIHLRIKNGGQEILDVNSSSLFARFTDREGNIIQDVRTLYAEKTHASVSTRLAPGAEMSVILVARAPAQANLKTLELRGNGDEALDLVYDLANSTNAMRR